MENKLKLLSLLPLLVLTSCGGKKDSKLNYYKYTTEEQYTLTFFTNKIEEKYNDYIYNFSFIKYDDSYVYAPHYLITSYSNTNNYRMYDCKARIVKFQDKPNNNTFEFEDWRFYDYSVVWLRNN